MHRSSGRLWRTRKLIGERLEGLEKPSPQLPGRPLFVPGERDSFHGGLDPSHIFGDFGVTP